jgi:hypothetical protein
MQDIRITIKNALTGTVEKDFTATVVDAADLDYMHKGYREAYPDSFVNFKMDDGGFIYGQPHNMAADERRYEKGTISWQGYIEKWYPTLAENMEAV